MASASTFAGRSLLSGSSSRQQVRVAGRRGSRGSPRTLAAALLAAPVLT